MSPEQTRGGNVDRRTDIFAMGIVLYKLTTGLHPFLGENDLITMRNIITRPVLPPRVKNPGFPQELEQVLVKCLQKDPEKRYQTMIELGNALERALGSLGIADDDIGGFVRTLMGDRGAKRRAALRDAVRAADERFATGTHQLPVVVPQVHENVSEIILTKMNSGVTTEELLLDRISVPSGTPSALSADSPTVIVGGSGSPTGRLARLAAAPACSSAWASRWRRPRRPSCSSARAAERAPPRRRRPAGRRSWRSRCLPPRRRPARQRWSRLPSASATSTVVSINDLPNAEDSKKKTPPRRRPRRQGHAQQHGRSRKSPRSVSTQWVPTVQNPGF